MTGADGPRGYAGEMGVPGANATSGVKGEKGDRGYDGVLGPEGLRGQPVCCLHNIAHTLIACMDMLTKQVRGRKLYTIDTYFSESADSLC